MTRGGGLFGKVNIMVYCSMNKAVRCLFPYVQSDVLYSLFPLLDPIAYNTSLTSDFFDFIIP